MCHRLDLHQYLPSTALPLELGSWRHLHRINPLPAWRVPWRTGQQWAASAFHRPSVSLSYSRGLPPAIRPGGPLGRARWIISLTLRHAGRDEEFEPPPASDVRELRSLPCVFCAGANTKERPRRGPRISLLQRCSSAAAPQPRRPRTHGPTGSMVKASTWMRLRHSRPSRAARPIRSCRTHPIRRPRERQRARRLKMSVCLPIAAIRVPFRTPRGSVRARRVNRGEDGKCCGAQRRSERAGRSAGDLLSDV